jgi:DNA invertase Pin-like site-specific DNA recombinase
MSETTLVPGKIGPAHLGRDAYVYVRQSTLTQVQTNFESLSRQYELRERAVLLGWDAHQVKVIDADLGRSGSEATAREGFKELVADVGLGQVGIIFGIEVSRLARNNSDWYQLLDLCALTNTLIADSDGVYHPAEFNDRLVLGLKGTMSEAELHLIRSRLTAGLRHKAERGELRQGLPVGFDYDPDARIVLSPDEAVVEAIGDCVRPIRSAGVGPAGVVVAARRRAVAAATAGTVRADRVGAGHLSGGARLSDQPLLCRCVRVRPDENGETA